MMKQCTIIAALLCLSTSALADYTSLQSDGNLVAYFPCEDNAATTTVTNSVGTNAAIAAGGPNSSDISTTGPTAWQTLAFDCNDERIEIDPLSFTGSLAVAFWANRNDTAASHTIISTDATDRLLFAGSGTLRLTIDSINYDLTVSDTTNWHHYVVIYRASDDTIDLIVDGAEADVDNSGPTSLTWDAERLAVQTLAAAFFNGQMSDIFIFDRDLSLAEAQDLYNGPASGDPNPLTPTIPGGTPDPLKRILP